MKELELEVRSVKGYCSAGYHAGQKFIVRNVFTVRRKQDL